MKFSNIKSYTYSEKDSNEDGFYIGDNIIIVIDGATGLDSSSFEVNKFVSLILDYFSLYHDFNISIENNLINAINSFKNDYTFKNELSMPSACFSCVRINNNKLEVFSLGDNLLLVEKDNGEIDSFFDSNLESLDNSVLNDMVKLSKEKKCSVIETREFDEIKNKLAYNRLLRNKDGGYYNLDLTDKWVSHGYYKIYDLGIINRVMLMSDGFSQILDYGFINSYKELLDLIETDNKYAEEELIKYQNEDYLCNKNPRFKKCDDTTYVFSLIK